MKEYHGDEDEIEQDRREAYEEKWLEQEDDWRDDA